MLTCSLFGLVVIITLFLVPQGAKLCRTLTGKFFYKYTLLTIYAGGIFWLTLINRLGMEVSRVRVEPFYVVRLLAKCYIGTRQLPAYICKNALKNSKSLFDSVHATPIEDLLLNIILFMPLGFLLPYIWPKLNFWKTLLCGLCLSACIETTQYLAQWGCMDIDDIFNNTLGTCIGYACFALYRRIARV